MQRILKAFLKAFELRSDERIRYSFQKFPYSFWITDKPGFPYRRVRLEFASIVRQKLHKRCPQCHRGFAFRELIGGRRYLTYFQSGAIVHNACYEEVAMKDPSMASILC